MRQGQQNRRGRGRGRKTQNPLARNYESNGPDVKIRGTAAHVAEKYMSLARDALASGDMVTAESYLQHAEHYNRIIMAAQQQLAPQQGGQPSEAPNGGGRYNRWHSDPDEDTSEEESAEGVAQGAQDHQGRPDRERTGGGGQDRERHAGNREHHPGNRERGRGRQGANGTGEGVQDANGSEPAEAQDSDEENAPDTVS
jgi:Domain of unknown function (DUF4167)